MHSGPITDEDVANAVPQVEESFLWRYLKWTRPQTDAPMAYHLLTGLALIGVTTPHTLGVPYAGPLLRPNVFGLAVGRSGEDRKSTAVMIGRDLLSSAAPELIGVEPGSEPGLVDSLAIQPTTLITYSEFGTFLKKSVSNSYFSEIKTRMNELFDCGPIGRRKANGKGVHIEYPRASFLGACAREYLENYTESVDWTGGFMGRWIIMYAHRQRTLALGRKPNEDLRASLVDYLASRAECVEVGPCVGFDAAATRTWVRWFEEISSRSLPASIIGIRARVPTMAVKIALLLAWDYGEAYGTTEKRKWAITVDQLLPAIAIAELHLQSIVHISETLAESKDMRDRRKILDLITYAQEPLAFGELLGPAKLLRRRVTEIIETLADEGLVSIVRRADGKALYRRTPVSNGQDD